MGEIEPQSFVPQSFEPQSFEPQSFESGVFEPADLETRAAAQGAPGGHTYPPTYGSQPYGSQPYGSPPHTASGYQTPEPAGYMASRVYEAPSAAQGNWSPASTERNWMGIASIILGLLGGGVIGVVLGWLGVVAAREGRATNGRTARAGVILNIVAMVVLVGVAIVAMDMASSRGSSQNAWSSLAVGNCVNQSPGAKNNSQVTMPKRVSCQDAHWGQVYFKATATGDAYPGGSALTKQANVCVSKMAIANVDPVHFADVYPTIIVPTEESWAARDRTIVCVLSNAENSVTGSWVVGS